MAPLLYTLVSESEVEAYLARCPLSFARSCLAVMLWGAQRSHGRLRMH